MPIHATQGPILTLPNPPSASLSVRASAMVFADPRSRAVSELIAQVAPSDVTVLVIGETGTGKELVARHLHGLSKRSGAPFVAVNCGAFSESLAESELFGHEAGAFTGAQGARSGWFEAADRGTLFLDEIGDLTLALQVKLLRVLQEREVVRVGSRTPIPVDVRLVAATNVDLQQAVLDGRFRADLYYRLRVITVDLPPLRKRINDILPLAEHFIDVYSRRLHVSRILGDEAQRALTDYPWPGNIRELENVIHRALLLATGEEILPEDLQLDHAGLPQTTTAEPVVAHTDDGLQQAIERLLAKDQQGLFDTVISELVRTAYARCDGNQVRAAEVLGLSRNTYRTLLKRYGLLAGDGRTGRINVERHQQVLSPAAPGERSA